MAAVSLAFLKTMHRAVCAAPDPVLATRSLLQYVAIDTQRRAERIERAHAELHQVFALTSEPLTPIQLNGACVCVCVCAYVCAALEEFVEK